MAEPVIKAVGAANSLWPADGGSPGQNPACVADWWRTRDDVLELQRVNTACSSFVVEVANARSTRWSRGRRRSGNGDLQPALERADAAAALASRLRLLDRRRRVSQPILEMAEVMHRLAERDMSVAVPASAVATRSGRMADAVQVFKERC